MKNTQFAQQLVNDVWLTKCFAVGALQRTSARVPETQSVSDATNFISNTYAAVVTNTLLFGYDIGAESGTQSFVDEIGREAEIGFPEERCWYLEMPLFSAVEAWIGLNVISARESGELALIWQECYECECRHRSQNKIAQFRLG